MIRIRRTIHVVSILHIIWGICLVLDSKIDATSSSILVREVGGYATAAMCIMAGIMAANGLRAKSSFAEVMWCLPQQFLLMLGVGPILVAIFSGVYADGTAIPGHSGSIFWAFSHKGAPAVALDQSIYLILTAYHTSDVLAPFRPYWDETLTWTHQRLSRLAHR